ncbi:RdRP-domain-containing protein [Xylariaceae sp. FL0662B]|nr:RdRP-domain-containing protein [Xylariaceae sp. FL0662B]
MAGMEVFMRNLPLNLTHPGLRTQLEPYIQDRLKIYHWDCQKARGKQFGSITFLHRIDGETFLRVYGEIAVPGYTPKGNQRTRSRLTILNTLVYCQESKHSADPFLLKTIVKAAEDRKQQDRDEQPAEANNTVAFELRNLSCGHYEYHNDRAYYITDMEWAVKSHGIAKFTRHALVLTFDLEGINLRVEMPYRTVDETIVSTNPPCLVLTLWEAPRFFQVGGQTVELAIAGLTNTLRSMNLSQQGPGQGNNTRTRLTQLPHHTGKSHGKIVGQSLVYCLSVSADNFHQRVEKLKAKERLSLTHHNLFGVFHQDSQMYKGMMELNELLQSYSNIVPFDVLFQFQALVQNGYLLPKTVVELLKFLRWETAHLQTTAADGPLISAGAVKKLFSQIPFAGPNVGANTFDPEEIWSYIKANEDEIRQGLSQELISERARQNLTMVYKVQVTPTRVILLGPEPEAKNRILRKFPDHTGYFARVQFCEEDGQDLFFNARVSLDMIYTRFKDILMEGIPIAGRVYKFLGFSHSSLRAHAVWFMAAFVDRNKSLQTYFSVIGDLGKFNTIFSPARCAARIGQAFSETPFSVDLEELGVEVARIEDVKSKDGSRVFSDGVGMISRDLMDAINAALPLKKSVPTCFQIRWAGAKGMLCLNDDLEGLKLYIRPSMEKFESKDSRFLEICDMATKPIPLVLNRQMIKILEDMGVPGEWFFKLQNREVKRLRMITAQTDNTVIFLKQQKVGEQIRFHQFIRRLDKLGIDYRKDKFLCSLVEAVVLREVRLLKHKARIPVEKGVTLFGVMDEFCFLEEDEVYITFDNLPGGHYLDLDNRLVIITRSPALHPGDIQIRLARVPPEDHPLRELKNCIVFSQQGTRDLPSQLSGGDLDGDIYNIIWDHAAVTSSRREFQPADYPRVPPLNIGRAVTQKDMTNFFVDFMATDQLGVIATKHIILADMKAAGTVDSECQLLAEMHSTGVDYSKTGIPIDQSKLKGLTRTRYRPDFLAPAPPANIVDRTEIAFEAPIVPSKDEDEDDDRGPSYRYYKSDKILGKLYQAIDEKNIWKEDIHRTVSRNGASVWDLLISHIKRQCKNLGTVDWERAIAEARRIRSAYEDAIWNASINYSDHPSTGLTEIEVFTGSIFNKTGVQTRRQRDTSLRLKDEFNRVSKWIEGLIRKRGVKSAEESDSDTDGGASSSSSSSSSPGLDLSEGASPLELSIACLHVSTAKMDALGSYRGDADYQSFKVIAGHCALRELEFAIEQREMLEYSRFLTAEFSGARA